MNHDTYLEIKDRFFYPHNLLDKFHKARTGYKEQIASLKAQADTYSQDYTDKKVKEVEGSLRATAQESYESFAGLADKLAAKLIEVDNRPITEEQASQLSGYVSLIASGIVDYKEAKQINANFIGDQTALKMLQRAYEKAGTSDGGVDKLIYSGDLEQLPDWLRDVSYSVFIQGNNVNDLGRALGKVAGFYNVTDYDWSIDPTGFDQELRAAAGLPIEG